MAPEDKPLRMVFAELLRDLIATAPRGTIPRLADIFNVHPTTIRLWRGEAPTQWIREAKALDHLKILEKLVDTGFSKTATKGRTTALLSTRTTSKNKIVERKATPWPKTLTPWTKTIM